MKRQVVAGPVLVAILTVAALNAGPAPAQDTSREELLRRIEQLEKELNSLKALVESTNESAGRAETVAAEAARAAGEAKEAANAATIGPVAYEGKTPDTMWHIAGYAASGLDISNSDESDTFVAGKFNPGFHFQYKDLVIFEGELEFEIEDNETKVALEYSSIDLLLHDNLTIVVGKYISPIGQFQERLHPDWINRAASVPVGFGHDGVQPISDVGVQFRGGVPLGNNMKATYAIAVGNGPRLGHGGGVELEGFGADDNDNKSVGGRIGFFPMPYLEVGGSYLSAKVDGLMGTGPLGPTRAGFDLWGFDAAYTKGPWDVRLEYLRSTRDELFSAGEEGGEVELLDKQTLKAWYAQAAYRLSQLSDNLYLGRLEPVVRYGRLRAEGNHELEEMAQNNFYMGLNYWLVPSFVFRGGYEIRDFEESGVDTEKVLQLEAAYGF